jgi:hypothetical protein
VEALVLHEHADNKRVARLEERLREEGYLKNPPMVAPIPNTGRYVVLDGANRTTAIERMGIPHILAQVVNYRSPQVELYTWHHLITGREPATFLEEIRGVHGLLVRPASLDAARAALAQRSILAYIITPDGTDSRPAVYTVDAADAAPGSERPSPQSSTLLLNAMVDTYKNDPMVAIHRVNTDLLEELLPYYDEVSGLIVFPPYTPDDILHLAQTGTKVPTGITRHIISPRALRVNIPLSVLSSEDSLEAKNAWWHEQVKRKLAANEIRLYQEPTYLFDE